MIILGRNPLEDMDVTEARFLAALADTEGCISAQFSHYYTPVFSVKMASLLPLWMCQKWGGALFKNKPKKGKLLYKWNLMSRNELRILLEKIKPYLLLKQKQAEIALQMLDVLNKPFLRIKQTEEQRNQLKALRDEIHKFNHAEVPDIDLALMEEKQHE